VQKDLLTELDGRILVGLRSLLTLICLAPWAARELKTLWPQRQELLKLLPLVIIGFAIGITLQAVGAGLTTATNLGFLVNLSEVFTPLLCWLKGQQELDRVTVLACGASLFGAALLSQRSPSNFGAGDVLKSKKSYGAGLSAKRCREN
jgi:drug/metabolite transporter (DMT)-like permease